MSATFAKEDKNWINMSKERKIKQHIAGEQLLNTFDVETEFDIKVIESNMKKLVFLKKVCILKLIIFPLEYTFTSLMFKKQYRANKMRMAKLYYKLLTNAIKLEVFEKQLVAIAKDGVI